MYVLANPDTNNELYLNWILDIRHYSGKSDRDGGQKELKSPAIERKRIWIFKSSKYWKENIVIKLTEHIQSGHQVEALASLTCH